MGHLINRKQIKIFIMAKLKAMRPGMEEQLTRVSKSALDNYEARLRIMIEDDIMTHRSAGKTFNP
jgi:hypothetical protein